VKELGRGKFELCAVSFRRVIDCVLALTPALSHRMGEGELFADSRENEGRNMPHGHPKNKQLTCVVPSPQGRGSG